MVEPDSNPIRSTDSSDFQPHVIHFFGHVTTDERDDEVVGCINDENNLLFAPFQSFAACIAAALPRLLILQAPEGVQLHRSKISKNGLLAELAQKRLPYILSFQHPLSEQGGLTFLRELYRSLFDHQSVPEAVSSGRGRLNREAAGNADANAFGSPALYTALPHPGPLHFRLISGQDAGEAPGAEVQVDKMTLAQKIDWYGREIRRLVENSELEMALDKCREIILIAVRSPDTDQPRAQGYQNQLSLLINRFNDVKKSFDKGDIDYKERSRQYLSIGNNLLEYFLPSGLPGITTKVSDAKKIQVTPPKANVKTEDNLDPVR
ncbi:MAG: hypothetical protein IPM81_13225 [Saprospirales bacterium]|nr:hypothetical protein [Saprospirales bacterium]